MLNKSQSNNPSMQVTEALYQKNKILPNLYILDSFPSLSLIPECLEQSKVKWCFVWCGHNSLGKLCTVSFAFWVLNFRSYIWSMARALERHWCPYTWFSWDNLINNSSTNLFRNLLYWFSIRASVLERVDARLALLFKIYNGLIPVDARKYLRHPTRSSRHSH